MGKFIEKSKRGEVMGNSVVCKPVPFALALAGMTAETDAERIKALAKGVEPSTIEADNARERTWTVTFRPCGAEPTPQS